MNCDICGEMGWKGIEGIRTCDNCYNEIYLLRNGDIETVELYQKKSLDNCSEIGKELIHKLIQKALSKGNYAYDYEKFKKEEEYRKKQEEYRIAQKELKENSGNIYQNMLMTTSNSFEGHVIKAYKGVCSGECILGTGFLSEISASVADLLGSESNRFSEKLKEAKEAAIEKLKAEVWLSGGNAIIGVDFDYITLYKNILGVVANGTAVLISEMEE